MRAFPLILSICALALLVAPALAADVSIPVNRDYMSSDGMVVHFDKVVISDDYHGNTYSPDPANTKWYDLYYTFENKGSKAQTGHLEVSFYDDKGNKYPSEKNITDITMEEMQPGTKSDKERFVEAGVIPKDTKIVGFQVFDDFKSTRFDIVGGQPAAPPSSTGVRPTPGREPCTIALVLPFLAVGLLMASRIKH